MTESEAYPLMPDRAARALQTFAPGDRVTVGPAYRMDGQYHQDGLCDTYLVIARDGTNYTVGYHPDWPLCTVNATRLQKA